MTLVVFLIQRFAFLSRYLLFLKTMKRLSLIFLLLTLIYFSCKKESIVTSKNATIALSADTLRFDTLFTTTGSVTQYFVIRNENNQKLILENVTVRGGAGS